MTRFRNAMRLAVILAALVAWALPSSAQAAFTLTFRQTGYAELVVTDNDAAKALQTISNVARTGQIGDGKIFVTPLAEVIRIRTGETGPEAI